MDMGNPCIHWETLRNTGEGHGGHWETPADMGKPQHIYRPQKKTPADVGILHRDAVGHRDTLGDIGKPRIYRKTMVERLICIEH